MAQSIDEIEDLTRFADESFDTDEVDLFEFTGVDDSPLTRLKSIILSLDWEISDDILDELVEEVENLRGMWEGDKVAQVYLQGIDKVGKYLRAEGAYAHPNAIKLLLTLFYNYEKIISSPDISGDEITILLKSDIRKFKVLQYQIGNKEGAPEKTAAGPDAPAPAPAETSEDDQNLLSLMNATILGLEWEVTDEGLALFDQQTRQMQEELAENAPALILVQGLQALGSYISDEKADAHPDAFTLLHSFNEGLNLLLGDEELTTEKRQEILIDRVGRLNTLKEMIAGTAPTQPIDRGGRDEVDDILDLDQAEAEAEPEAVQTAPATDEEEIPEDAFEMPGSGESDDELNIDFDLEESSFDDQSQEENDEEGMVASLTDDSGAGDESEEEFNVDFDLDETEAQANAAMETADEQYPEDLLDPSAIQPVSDRVADDFIEEELKISTGFTSALDDTDADDAFTLDNEALSSEELEEELELIFGDESENHEGSMVAEASTDEGFEEFELSFDDEELEEETVVSPDLDIGEALEETGKDDDSGLDFDDNLFLADDDDDQAGEEESLVTPALADADEEAGEAFEPDDLGDEPAADLEDKLDSLFGSSDDIEAPAPEEEEMLTPALDDADEESGFREDFEAEGMDDGQTDELEGKLDSFFGRSEEEPDIDVEREPDAAVEDDPSLIEDDGVVAALADEDAESGFQEGAVVADLKEDPSADIQGKLDSFFGEDDGDAEAAVPPSAQEDTVTPALAEEELDSFFAEDDTDLAPALSDSDDSTGFNEDVEGSDLSDSSKDEIGDKLDSFFDSDDEESDTEDSFPGAALLSLAAVAAKLPAQPNKEDLHQVAELVTARKNEEQTTQQTVILTLLESAVSLLSKNTAEDAADAAVVRELTTALDQGDDPAVLIQAVSLYTRWQQKIFASGPAQSAPAKAGSGDAELLLQVKESFGQLRETLEKEFAAIREDLHKK